MYVSSCPAPSQLGPDLSYKVARLREELNRPELREEASAAIRSLIEGFRLVQLDGKLEIELAGALAGIVALTSNSPAGLGGGCK